MAGNLTRTKQRVDQESITDITIAIKFRNNRGINKQQLFITASGVLSPPDFVRMATIIVFCSFNSYSLNIIK